LGLIGLFVIVVIWILVLVSYFVDVKWLLLLFELVKYIWVLFDEGYCGILLVVYIFVSIRWIVIGLVLVVIFGVFFGLVMGCYCIVGGLFGLVFVLLWFIFLIVFIFLVVLYFGFGEVLKIVLIFLVLFMFIVFNVEVGV